ncbi:glycosyltransferase [Streptomyces aurantiacus]|uniref:Glycosyl transferase family 2 n=1 Tax=Streptomyces aurantiacus TaxID=47760 RepID=A0A7G1PC90_9ACTN|nr:glycosyltransferase [Streptomyces aurantiacus]BCL32672.1 glycosyl transferase family 2 [Streptomyces aurantiacus]
MSALVWIAAGSLAAWLWLLLGQGFFWRTDVRLPPRRDPDSWPSVCVVVPARDEAAVLPESLPSLLAQEYPGRAEIFLVDDGSSDGTGELARELGRRHGELPLTVGSPGEPPAGWTGKLWAVRHGIGLARARGPEYLLLTDADIAHAPDSLRKLVASAVTGDFDLVSQMARLRVESVWERLVVPAFVYFFAQLYPFRWIAVRGSRTAAAAGGCVLLRTAAAERARIPDAIRHAVIDDVALARAVKGSGGHIWLGLAERGETVARSDGVRGDAEVRGDAGVRRNGGIRGNVDSVRPYPRLHDLWRMVSRSAYAQLRHNPLVLAGTVAGLAVVYLVPPVALVVGLAAGRYGVAVAGGLAWLLMTATYLPMLRYYRQPLLLAPLLPFTALLYLCMTVDSAVQHYRGRGAAWKGRTYARPDPAPEEG